uniref:Uncharacterized protein n=1 Tax=Suricata suricatta TaxID=37032 RepID=A0A673VPS3_SURSU
RTVLGKRVYPLKQWTTQERVNVEPYSDFNHWLRALSIGVLGRGFRGRLQTAQGPSLAPRPPHHFTSGLRPHPCLGGDTFLGLEEERIRVSWLPYSFQLPGFLIDGDYYVIDLLDRTVPALGTLCPFLEACPKAWHQTPRARCPALPAPPASPPSRGGDPRATVPGGPGATSWDGAGARLGVGQAPSRSQCRPAELGFISASPGSWDPPGPSNLNLELGSQRSLADCGQT